jgi:flagellar hook-associated protein 1 FlgK
MSQILNIGVSALNAYQRALNIAGHNVANVGNESYSRQRSEPVAQLPTYLQGSYIGNGVKSTHIERVYDAFLAGQMRASQATTSDLDAFYKYASQIDQVVADGDVGLDPALQSFFDGLQGLADDPGSTAVREVLLSESQSLVDRFHFLDGVLEEGIRQVHDDMAHTVGEINELSKTIVDLNLRISRSPGIHQGAWPNDLLDQRDQAVNELSHLISVSTLNQDDGTMTVYFGKGQSLVVGADYNELTLLDSPEVPNHKEIAFDVDGNITTITDQIAGGELTGLLRARDEVLEPGRNQLGLVALGLSFQTNAQHSAGLNLMDQTGLDFFTDLSLTQSRGSSRNAATTDYLFDIQVTDPAKLPADDFLLVFNGGADPADLANYSLTLLGDGQDYLPAPVPGAFPWDFSADLGLSIDLNAGTSIAAGDRFYFSPTLDAASGLELALRDPEAVAAASPIELSADANNSGSGAVSLPAITQVSGRPVQLAGPVSLSYTNDLNGDTVLDDPGFLVAGGPGGTLTYDPATQSGGQTYLLDMGGYKLGFTVTGVPAVGDSFLIGNGSAARVSDNRNALLLADLQQWRGMRNGSATLQDTFGNYVAATGTRTHQADINLRAQERMLEINRDAFKAVTGVNLDEEAANLIRFQQAYQAAAQCVNIASTLFDSLIAAVR